MGGDSSLIGGGSGGYLNLSHAISPSSSSDGWAPNTVNIGSSSGAAVGDILTRMAFPLMIILLLFIVKKALS